MPRQKVFVVKATSIASEEYEVEADSAEEAQAKVLRGEFDHWRDLGHDDLDIVEVQRIH